MSTTVDTSRASIRRRAIEMEIGGFRPTADPRASWFGKVTVALPGEDWPRSDGKPMFALCQINLSELPFRPPRLDDFELITVFIGPDELPDSTENGSGWCLRSYRSVDQLVELAQCDTTSPLKPFPMRPIVIDDDYPCWDDLPAELPMTIEQYRDTFKTHDGFKLGGWPRLIQSGIYWAPWQQHPIAPEYVFQIDTTEKGNWMWGDNGVGYFGRGTAPGREDEWALEWQCF